MSEPVTPPPPVPLQSGLPQSDTVEPDFNLASVSTTDVTGPTNAQPPPSPESVGLSMALVVRLSAIMLLQFFPPGLWTVTVGTYIAANTGSAGTGMFHSSFVGVAGIAGAVGALMSPLLFGALADSWFRAERLITVLNIGCAAILVAIYSATNQWWFFVGLVIYYQFCAPAFTLTHSLSLRHLAGARKYFPIVRASGTLGWILALWFVGSFAPWWWDATSKQVDSSNWPMKFAAVAHLVVALFAVTLPKTTPLAKAGSWRTLLQGCGQLIASQPRMVRFLVVSFFATISAQFYNMFANLYLNNIGVENAATKLSVGQMVEIGCMLLLPWLLVRWGPKRVFVLGVLAWVIRYVCLAFGGVADWPLTLVYSAIGLHGFCYVFVYITAFIYVDHAATPETQNAAQGLLAIVTSGLGHMAGSLLAGLMQSWYLTPTGVEPAPYNWQAFFLVAAGLGLLAIGLFWLLMGFRREVMPGEIEPDEAV